MRISDWSSDVCSSDLPVSVSVHRQGELSGRFALLMVTTLECLLLNTKPRNNATSIGALKLMAIEERPATVFRALWAALGGRLGRSQVASVRFDRGDEIRIEGARYRVIVDGELFETSQGSPIQRKPTRSEANTAALQSLMRNSVHRHA